MVPEVLNLNFMDFVYVISGLLSLIFLICFFVLCSNVGAIRKSTYKHANDIDGWIKQYRKNAFLGREDQAKSCLEEAFYLEAVYINSLGATEDVKNERYAALKEKFNKIAQPGALPFNIPVSIDERL